MRKGLVGIAMLAIGLGAMAGPASAKPKSTKLTIDYQYGNLARGPLEFESFFGDVTSKKDSCTVDRKVTVFRKKSGKDQKIGSDKSTPDPELGGGDWFVDLADSEPGPITKNGNYYASTPKTNGCKAAVSKTIKVDN